MTTHDPKLKSETEAAEEHCKAMLDPRGFDLAKRWAMAVESETATYYTDRCYEIVEELARHFPAFAAAIRRVHEHVEDQRLDLIGACCARAEDGETLQAELGRPPAA